MKKYVQKLTVVLLLTLVGGMNAWAQGVEKVTEFYLFVPGDNGSLPSYTPFTDKKDGTYSLELAVTRAMVSDNPLRFCISDHDGNSDGNDYGATIEQSIISETNHENIPLSIDGYVLQIPVLKAGNYNFVIDNTGDTPILNVEIDPLTYYLFVPGDNGSLPSYTRFTDNKDGTYSLELAVTRAMVSDNPLRFCISDHDGNSDGNDYGATIEQSIISETNHENIPLSIDGYVLQIPVLKAGNYNFVIDNRSNTPLLNVNIDPFTYYLYVPGDNGSLPYYDRFTVNEDGTYSLHLAVTSTMVSGGPYTFLLSDDDNNFYGATQMYQIDEAVIYGSIMPTGAGSNHMFEILNPGNYTFVIIDQNGGDPMLKVEKEGGIATSIQGIPTSQEDHIIYNLNGQRVKQTHKGIYVVNGKKIVVK